MKNKRQRISRIAEFIAIFSASTVLISKAIFGILGLIPVVGIVGNLGSLIISIASFFGFSVWYMTLGAFEQRVFSFILMQCGILLASLFASILPFFGPMISALLALWFLIRLWIFIKLVQHADKRYNEKNVA